ncbi:hypothetical protein ZTR_09858 [Talaromyces verruculosus]|nr:hypothetical protein ZTR_09858 [Talaromyces verruculosus]
MGVKDQPWGKENPDRVKLLGPVCVAYGHPDLEKTHKYLTDFGLVEAIRKDGDVYYRGYGVQPVVYIAKETPVPEFLGVYFEAASLSELEKATKVPGAGAISDFVAGGKVVTITDPSGIPFHVVFGLEKRDFTPPKEDSQPYNFPAPADDDVQAKPRRGTFHRMTKGIIPVHKLGHCGYVTENFDVSLDFYCQNFNFKPSDVILGPGDSVMMVFFHVDLGETYSEHHSFFLAQPGGPLQPGTPHHSAFEVNGIDSQFIGHDYLSEQGYKSFWGIGRHIEGSQVFDYWFDLDGFLVEHYTDGDLVNEDTPIGWIARDLKDGNNWGPALPHIK